MPDDVTEPGTTEAATTADTTETTSQLPTSTPEAVETTTGEPQETAEATSEETTEAPAEEEGRGKWDKERQKRDEARAMREKEMLDELKAVREELKTLKTAPATQATQDPPAEDIETLRAKVKEAAAKYRESFDPGDAAEALELNTKLSDALLQRDRDREQAIKARDERESSTTEDQRRITALHADWNKSGITVAEGDALVRQAFQRADARGLKGAERQAAAEMAYDLLLGNLKQSKKSPPASQRNTTASATSGKTPAGTRLTPRNSGVQIEPHQRGQAAKTIAALLHGG